MAEPTITNTNTRATAEKEPPAPTGAQLAKAADPPPAPPAATGAADAAARGDGTPPPRQEGSFTFDSSQPTAAQRQERPSSQTASRSAMQRPATSPAPAMSNPFSAAASSFPPAALGMIEMLTESVRENQSRFTLIAEALKAEAAERRA